MWKRQISATRARLMMFGLVIGISAGSVRAAEAQISIIDPNNLPDVSVTVDAPERIVQPIGPGQNYEGLATIKVASQGPVGNLYYQSAPFNRISMTVFLTGLWPERLQAESPLICVPQFDPGMGYYQKFNCTGDLPYGSSANIQVFFHIPFSYFCSWAYTDAVVTLPRMDRLITNNRSIARTSLNGCP
jgi:hypothetical protein